MVHIQDMFLAELRDARRVRIASLPVHLQVRYQSFQGWADFPYEQPAMSAMQCGFNDEVATTVLPQSIVMSRSMPKLHGRPIVRMKTIVIILSTMSIMSKDV